MPSSPPGPPGEPGRPRRLTAREREMLDRIAAELAQSDPDLDLMMSGWQARLTPGLVLAQLAWLGVGVIVVVVVAVVESALVWPIVGLLLATLSMQGVLVLWSRWR